MSPGLNRAQRNGSNEIELNEKGSITYVADTSCMRKDKFPQNYDQLGYVNHRSNIAADLLNLTRDTRKGIAEDDAVESQVNPERRDEMNLKEGFGQSHGELKDNEEKPNHSYISLIACAVLSSPGKRLVLSDIYNFIQENFTYFRNRGSGWRNSIRHNLSLNECFVKAGRSPNGKGHYWAINPTNYDDFVKGDFRRRRTQRRNKRMRGISQLVESTHPIWYQPYRIKERQISGLPSSDFSAYHCNYDRLPLHYFSQHRIGSAYSSSKTFGDNTLPQSGNRKSPVYSPSKTFCDNMSPHSGDRKPKNNRPFDIENLLKDDDNTWESVAFSDRSLNRGISEPNTETHAKLSSCHIDGPSENFSPSRSLERDTYRCKSLVRRSHFYDMMSNPLCREYCCSDNKLLGYT